MEEGLLKEDGRKAMKKTLVAFSVFALAVAMVGAFASFHWLYGEYFRFEANKAEAEARLSALRAQCAESEKDGKSKLEQLAEEHEKRRTELVSGHV